MKYYWQYIVISTLLSLSHDLFRSAPEATEWAVYHFTESFSGISVLSAFALYLTVPYYKIGLKLLMAIYTILCIPTCLFFIIDVHQPDWLPLTILLVTFLFIILRANKWDINTVSGDEVKDGTYIVFKRVSSFWGWISALCGYGVGGCKLVSDGYQYRIRHNILVEQPFVKLIMDEIAFKLLDSNEPQKELHELVGMKYTFIKHNCLTSFSGVLAKYGVRVKTIFPSVFFGNFVKRSYFWQKLKR